MEYKQLHYFIAVADQGSFSKAAEKLYVTQPALSRHIARLEEELGVILFERNTRSLQLTAAGKELYDRSIIWIRDMEKMIQSVKRTAAEGYVREKLRICVEDGIFSMAGTGALEALQRFQQELPEVEIEYYTISGNRMKNYLAEGNADVGLVYLLDTEMVSKSVIEHCIYRGRLAWAVPKGWGFQEDSPAFYEKLSQGIICFPKERTCWNGVVTSLLSEHGCHANHINVMNYVSAGNFVMVGAGACMVPETYTQFASKWGDIVHITSSNSLNYHVSLIYAPTVQGGLLDKFLNCFPALGLSELSVE